MRIRQSLFLTLIAFWGVFASWTVFAIADDLTFDEAKMKAKEYQDLSQSDIIYSQEATKAQYYQNLQIIQLLSEIRDELGEVRSSLDQMTSKEESA